MTSDWPPNGVSDPIPYHRDRMHVFLIAIILTAVFATLATPALILGIDELLAKGTVYGLLWVAVVPLIGSIIHESLHYLPGKYFQTNPTFHWDRFLLFPNPSVVPLTTGIPLTQNIVMLASPFIVVGLVASLTMVFTDGLIAATAAYIFILNGGPSGADVYHLIRLSRLPKGTQFANFKDQGEISTEYCIPESPLNQMD